MELNPVPDSEVGFLLVTYVREKLKRIEGNVVFILFIDFVYRDTDILRGSQRNVSREILPLLQHNLELGIFVKYVSCLPMYLINWLSAILN
jgi:hypothetical protein